MIRDTTSERRCALPGSLMAPIAISVCRRQVVIVSHVTIRAGDYLSCRRQLMRSGQRPARHAVVENDVGPQGRIVARGAIRYSKGRPST